MKTLAHQALDAGKIIVLGLALSIGFSYLFAWTGPTAPPPEGNVPAPINVGSVQQEKSGLLVLQNLRVTTGTPQAGQVLTAVDNNGTVIWRNPPSTRSYTEVFHSSGSWVAPTGLTGDVLVRLWGAGAGGNSSCIGGSGGAGGYGELYFTPAVGTAHTFTVGQGGRGKQGYGNNTGNPNPPTGTDVAEAGGNTVFDSVYIAYGGNPPSVGGSAGTGGSVSANLTNTHTGANGTAGSNQYGGTPWGYVGAVTRDPALYIPGGGASGSDDGNEECDGSNGISGGIGEVSITYYKLVY